MDNKHHPLFWIGRTPNVESGEWRPVEDEVLRSNKSSWLCIQDVQILIPKKCTYDTSRRIIESPLFARAFFRERQLRTGCIPFVIDAR